MMPDVVKIPGCRGIGQTPKSILVECEDWDEPIWIPQSQIDDDSEVYAKGTEGMLIISGWIADQKGIG